MRKARIIRFSTYFILFAALLSIGLAGWLNLGSYESVKPIVDRLSADGDLESFTSNVFHAARIISAALGIVGLLLAAAILFFREKVEQVLTAIGAWLGGIRSLGSDTKTFFKHLKSSIPERSDLLALAVLILLGAVMRWMLSNLAMGHDEAYTYIVFARRDLAEIIKDYHLPNNHVFHSVLVHYSTMLFGSQPWAVRLPAILSLMGMVPTSYLIGRKYFTREVGLLTAAAVAVMPNFILTSLNARGYPVVAFLLMLVWLLALYLKKHNNLFAWFAFVIVSTLGFFTLPMMLYGFGMVLGWLFVSWLRSDVADEYPRWVFLRSLFLSGLAVVVLTVLLYTPIVLNNSLQALISPPVVRQLKVASVKLLSEDFVARVGGAWQEWHIGFPSWVGFLSLAGVLWAWIRFRKISPHKISLFGLGLLWILALLLVQMTVGWTRVWFFLSPIYFLYAFAGWFDLTNLAVRAMTKQKRSWLAAGPVLLVILAGSGSWWFQDSRYQELLSGSKGYDQVAAEFLAEYAQDGDLIATISPDAPMIWYYSVNLGIETDQFNLDSGMPFTHSLLVINTNEGQTVELLLDAKDFDLVSEGQIDLVFESGPLEIYHAQITTINR